MSFMEIFQPGLKHLREERERQRMNVAHPTNGADPLMAIDLEAGTATIIVAPSVAPEETRAALADAEETRAAPHAEDTATGQMASSEMGSAEQVPSSRSAAPPDLPARPDPSSTRTRTRTP